MSEDNKNNKKKIFKWAHRMHIVLSSLCINILALAVPIMSLQIYDRIIPNPGMGTLPVFIFGVCVAIFLETVMRLSRSYTLSWAGSTYEHKVSVHAMGHVLNSNIASLQKTGIGEYLQSMSAIGKTKDFNNGYDLTVYIDLLFVPAYLGLIAMVAGPLSIVPCAILMFFCVISLYQGQNLRQQLKRREDTDDRRYNFLIETLEGMASVKSYALENYFARRYEHVQDEESRANYRVTQAMSLTFNTGLVFASVMLLCVTSAGAAMVQQGWMTTGALIASVILSGRMMQPIQKSLALWARFQDYSLSRQKVSHLFEMPLHPILNVSQDSAPRSGMLSLNNVGFYKEGRGERLLEGITFEVKKGEVVLIDADRDEVRTTLLELIAGIYPPNTGEIIIDGMNIGQYEPETLIRHLGYMPTEAVIFRGTIRDNMTCFNAIAEVEAQKIAAFLNVNVDVAGLPGGFDTMLTGTNADIIPPGLKQRIAAVRVLAARPRIILFDQADRSLDRQGYDSFFNLLAKIRSSVSLVMASDDANIRKLATRCIFIRAGKIIYDGDVDGAPEYITYKSVA